MTSTDACGFIRRGRHGKGMERWWKLGGGIEDEGCLSDPDPGVYPKMRCPHPICRYLMVDGHLKCPQCFRQIEPVTDTNIATEVARREATARTKGKRSAFFHGQGPSPSSEESKDVPCRRKSSSSSGPVRTPAITVCSETWPRTTCGQSCRKRGFGNLVDRLQRDPFFRLNAANQDLVPEALNFIDRLAGCISPVINRTKAQILGEVRDGHQVGRLCGAERMEPGLPFHLVLEPAAWMVLALGLSP